MGLGMAALRKKPHHVIVGEVRGGEVRRLFQIALTGHGCVSSVHAPGPRDLLVRLGGDGMGVSATRQSGIDYLPNVQKARDAGGRMARRAASLAGVGPGPELHELFRYDPGTGGFLPGTVLEVAGSSRRPGYATRFLGIPDAEADMRRMSLLRGCAGAQDAGEVFGVLSRHYGVADPARTA